MERFEWLRINEKHIFSLETERNHLQLSIVIDVEQLLRQRLAQLSRLRPVEERGVRKY